MWYSCVLKLPFFHSKNAIVVLFYVHCTAWISQTTSRMSMSIPLFFHTTWKNMYRKTDKTRRMNNSINSKQQEQPAPTRQQFHKINGKKSLRITHFVEYRSHLNIDNGIHERILRMPSIGYKMSSVCIWYFVSISIAVY